MQTTACGARNLPSGNNQRNAAWLALAALALTLTCWLRLIAVDACPRRRLDQDAALPGPVRTGPPGPPRPPPHPEDPTRVGLVR